jgi:hypothetical protein
MVTVEVRDETTAGDVLAAMELQLVEERTSAREIIRARVHQEVRAHNAAAASRRSFRGLVQPNEEERALNPQRRPRRIDAQAQTEVAWDAFERGRVLLLVGDRQLTEIDEEVVLAPGTSAVFLKLVPLVGG